MADEERLQVETNKGPVTGLWVFPPAARAVVVVAHGAGNDLNAPLLTGFTDCLNEAGLGTLRFNFPYKEQGRKAPDPAATLLDAWRAAFRVARERAATKPVFVSGKSMGGRIASMAVADGMQADGVVFIGYPLHAPGRPDKQRDEHLFKVHAPMLFLEGTEDPFARFDLIEDLIRRLGRWATLYAVQGGDHSFRVKGERRPDEETGRLLASVAARWIQGARV